VLNELQAAVYTRLTSLGYSVYDAVPEQTTRIEEGTTNLLTSNDAQGKTLFISNNSSHSSNTLETSFGLNDLYSLKSVQLVVYANRGFYSSSFYPTVAGNVYTFSYYVYNATSTSHNFKAWLIFYDGSGNLVQSFESNGIPVPAQQWKRISVTATAPSDSTQCKVVGQERGTTSQVGDVYYFDSFQLEQKPYATSWTVGTRQPEILKTPTTYPYIVIGDDFATDWGTKSFPGWNVLVTIHIWSDYNGWKETKAIMDAAEQALCVDEFVLQNHTIAVLLPESAQVLRDPSGLRHGVLRLRVKII